MFIVTHHFLAARTHTHTHTVPRSLTHITRGGRQCSVPCINGSCARMTNSWPFIQMPRFRIIAPSSRRLTHSHARCRTHTHISRSRLRRHNIDSSGCCLTHGPRFQRRSNRRTKHEDERKARRAQQEQRKEKGAERSARSVCRRGFSHTTGAAQTTDKGYALGCVFGVLPLPPLRRQASSRITGYPVEQHRR